MYHGKKPEVKLNLMTPVPNDSPPKKIAESCQRTEQVPCPTVWDGITLREPGIFLSAFKLEFFWMLVQKVYDFMHSVQAKHKDLISCCLRSSLTYQLTKVKLTILPRAPYVRSRIHDERIRLWFAKKVKLALIDQARSSVWSSRWCCQQGPLIFVNAVHPTVLLDFDITNEG